MGAILWEATRARLFVVNTLKGGFKHVLTRGKYFSSFKKATLPEIETFSYDQLFLGTQS